MQPDPANLVLARNFGFAVLALAGVGLLTGKAYFRGVVCRADDPTQYWMAVVCQLVLGLFCVVGSLTAG